MEEPHTVLDLNLQRDDGQIMSVNADNMADILRRAYALHVGQIQEFQNEVKTLSTKFSKAQKSKHEYYLKGRDLRQRNDILLEEKDKLKEELTTASTRLCAPCRLCDLLKEQLRQQERQQEKMYNKVCEMMMADKDKRLESIKKQYADTVQKSKEASQRFEAEVQSRPVQVANDNNRGYHSDDTDSDIEVTDEINENNTSPSGSRMSNRLKRKGKRLRCRYNEEPLPESKKSKTSPGQTAKSYKPIRLEKSRSTPPILRGCGNEPESLHPHPHSAPNVLVPETCDFSMAIPVATDTDAARVSVATEKEEEEEICLTRKTRSQRARGRKPNIVVPETVPFDIVSSFSEEEKEEEEEEEEEEKDTVVEIDHHQSTPPSLSSTPLGTRTQHLNIPLSALRNSNSKEDRTVEQSLNDDHFKDGTHGDDTHEESLPESPVFDKNNLLQNKPTIQTRHLSSPSLFDEEDNNRTRHDSPLRVSTVEEEEEAESPLLLHVRNLSSSAKEEKKGRAAKRLEAQLDAKSIRAAEVDMSVQSEPSPSMLSGRTIGLFANQGKTAAQDGSELSRSESAETSAIGESDPSENVIIVEGEIVPITRNPGTKGVKSGGSPGRKRKQLKQSKLWSEPDSPVKQGTLFMTKTTSRERKSLVQTRISAKMFQKSKNKMRQSVEKLKEFNGKLAGNVSTAEQEKRALAQALKESIREEESRKAHRDASFFPEFTGPQFTSTPFDVLGQGGDETVFLKPSTPKRSTSRKSRSHEGRGLDPAKGSRSVGDDDLDLDHFPESSEAQLSKTSQYLEPVSILDIETREYEEDGQVPMRSQIKGSRSRSRSKSKDKVKTNEPTAKLKPKSSRKIPIISTQGLMLTNEQKQLADTEEDSHVSAVFGTLSGEHLDKLRQHATSREEVTRKDAVEIDNRDKEPEEEDEEEGSCPDVFASQAFAGGPTSKAQPLDDSFDRVPKSGPDYAYVDVVRKQAERRQLNAYTCVQCAAYYDGMGLTEEEKRERMKNCRHKARFTPPGTPEHFWSIGFPDTRECEEYMNVTQAKPSNFRRKRQLRKLFTTEKEEREKKDNENS